MFGPTKPKARSPPMGMNVCNNIKKIVYNVCTYYNVILLFYIICNIYFTCNHLCKAYTYARAVIHYIIFNSFPFKNKRFLNS